MLSPGSLGLDAASRPTILNSVNAQSRVRKPLGSRLVALVVLLIAAWILLHFLIHIAVAIATVVVIVAAIFAAIWAARVLL